MQAVILCSMAASWSPTSRSDEPSPLHRLPPSSGQWVQCIASRLAFLGFAMTMVAEMWTGKGALALLNVETGVEGLTEVEGILAFFFLLILVAPSPAAYKR